jgi:hypothetical protein
MGNEMKLVSKYLVSIAFGISFVGVASAAAPDPDRSTPEQTIAFVKKAVALVNKGPCPDALEMLSNQEGPFRERELFAIVLDKDAKVLAHTGMKKMIGANIIDLKDTNGVMIIKPWFDKAKKGEKKGWGDEYVFFNPKSKAMEPKNTYFELVDGEKCGVYMIAAGRHFLK